MKMRTVQLTASSQRASELRGAEKAKAAHSPWVTNRQPYGQDTWIYLQAGDQHDKSKLLQIKDNTEYPLPTRAYRNRSLAPKCLASFCPSLSPEEESLSFQPCSAGKHVALSVKTTPRGVHQPLLMPWNQGDPTTDS